MHSYQSPNLHSLHSESSHLHQTDTLATARTIHDHLTTTLHACPSHPYILVKQPSVSASDFEGETTAPHLRRRMNGHDTSIKTTQIVRSVIGDLSATGLADKLHSQCPHMTTVTLKDGQLPTSSDKAQLITVEMTPPAGSTEAERTNALDRNDLYLEQILSKIGKEYTVIYATTPAVQKTAHGEERFKLVDQQGRGQQVYEMDEPFPSSVKANHFKRDMSAYPRAENGSEAVNADLPLFEKYTFLSSGEYSV